MDIENAIAELSEERELIDAAILALERLAAGSGKRKGRPPKWLQAAMAAEAFEADGEPERAAPRKKRTFSPEARKRMAEAQRKRFATARGQSAGE